MQRHRFYSPPETFDNDGRVRLPPAESHHLARVLRLRPGDEAFAFDGRGREWRCRVTSGASHHAELEILEELADQVESHADLTLAQGLAKGEKFDLIVQKVTELGVRRIVPLLTMHSDVKLDDDRGDKRLERWRRVSLEALKQSGGRRLVEIAAPSPLADYLASLASGTAESTPVLLVFSERGGVRLNEALTEAKHRPITALIGPEGGWAGPELEALKSRGASFVSLGPRILRTETAAIAAIAIIQDHLGGLSR